MFAIVASGTDEWDVVGVRGEWVSWIGECVCDWRGCDGLMGEWLCEM